MGQGSSKHPQPFPVPLAVPAQGFQPTGYQRNSQVGSSILRGDSSSAYLNGDGGHRKKSRKGKEREGQYGSTGYVQDTMVYPYTAQFEGFYSQTGVKPGPSVGFIPPRSTDQQTTQPTFASSGSRNTGSSMAQAPPFPESTSMPIPQPTSDSRSRHRSHHSEPTLQSILEPLPPANPGVFGPPGPRPLTPLRNPLPPPPKDLYDTSPYRSLLRDLPENAALLTRSHTTPGHVSFESDRGGSGSGGLFGRKSKKGSGGLFRSSSSSYSQRPRHETVSVFHAPANQPPYSSTGFAAPQFIPAPAPATQPAPSQSRSKTQQDQPQANSVPPVKFDHHSHLSGFMNHSPHRVLYENKMYPSALHLHEALKFMEHKPELAERIREVRNIQDVYPLSASFQKFVRSDWGTVWLQMMEDVLYLKFKQHPDLRALLINTGIANIIYAEANDPFWGEGPVGEGANELGKALMRVRERLKAEGFVVGNSAGA